MIPTVNSHCPLSLTGRVDPNDPDSFAAIIGFNLNTTLSSSVPHSETDNVVLLSQTSNANNTGVWVFQVNGLEVKGQNDYSYSVPYSVPWSFTDPKLIHLCHCC